MTHAGIAPKTPAVCQQGCRKFWVRETGSLSLETVIVIPVILLIIFAIIQGSLYAHTRNCAQHAAHAAAISAAAYGATNTDGTTAANQVMSQTSDATNIHITITRTDSQVIATVTATSPDLVSDIFSTGISQSAAAPVERWTN